MLIEKGIAYTIKKGRNLMHRSVLISLGLVLCFLISGCTAQRGSACASIIFPAGTQFPGRKFHAGIQCTSI